MKNYSATTRGFFSTPILRCKFIEKFGKDNSHFPRSLFWRFADPVHPSSALWHFLHFFFVVVQMLERVQLFVTPWAAALQASLSFTISQSFTQTYGHWVWPFNHLILCHPLLFLPSIFLSLRVFANELDLCIRWPNYWSFSFSISPSNGSSELIALGLTGLISCSLSRLSRVFSSHTV